MENDQKRRRISFQTFSMANKILLVLSIMTMIPTLAVASITCKHHEYWDALNDKCVPCTKCNRHQIAVRPCQRHLDTVCQHLNSIEIDWSKSMASERPQEGARRNHHNNHHMLMTDDQFNGQSEDAASRERQELLLWDWQLIFLILAFISCLLFFLVTAFIFINYVRQWRKIKKQFDTGELHRSLIYYVNFA